MLNEQILKKLKEKTKEKPDQNAFIMTLLQHELEGKKWYTKEYSDALEAACPGGESQ